MSWLHEIRVWWIWTALPFIYHPLETIRDWLNPNRHDGPVDIDELRHLTPQEQKELLK